MIIFVCIFFLFLLFILTSSLKLKIKYLDKEIGERKIKYCIEFGIFLLGFIKIVSVHFSEKGMKIFKILIPYSKMHFTWQKGQFSKAISSLKSLNKLNFCLKHLDVHVSLGTEDTQITVLAVFILSMLIGLFTAKRVKQITYKNYFWEVKPIYNLNCFGFHIESEFSIHTLEIVKNFLKKTA